MPKPLKITLIALVALVALLAIGVAIIVATFDPQTYKPLLIERVQKDWQRTLAIPGPVRLSFFPKIGVQVGELSISERGSPDGFASARSARVSLALWPLLRQQVVVDRVQIDGLRARLVRQADGRTNVDDLFGAPADASSPSAASAAEGGALAFDIAGLTVSDAAIAVDDRANRRQLALSAIEISTGRLASGVPAEVSAQARLKVDTPAVDSELKLQGTLTMDIAARRHRVAGLTLALNGVVAGQPGVRLALGGDVDANLAAGDVGVTGLGLDGAWPRAGGEALNLKASGSATAKLPAGTAEVRLAGTLDGAQFEARLGLPRLSPPSFDVDLSIDRLDLDQRLAAAGAPEAAAPDTPLDLSALRGIDAKGQLRIKALQVAQLKIADLRIGLRAAGGRVDLNPVQAALYEGATQGSAVLDARGAAPRLSLKQSLTGVQVGPLLKDALGRDSLEGRGDVSLDVSAQGRSSDALVKALSGQARLELRDGAWRGVNVAQVIRSARAKLGGGAGEQSGAGSRTEKTDFSEMSASFRIDRGVARNDDLLAKSPLLRITGNGDIDLGERRIDYLVKATVVTTLQGQGGPELQALRGQTVPVKLSGPLDAVGWRIDFAGMAKEAVKAKVETKKEEVKEKLREKLGDKLKGLFGK